MRILAVWLLTASLLAGCAQIPAPPLAARAAVGNFAVDARFALKITHPDGRIENSGGRLSWTHENRMDRMLLANPLGIGLAEIESAPGHASLRTGDGKNYSAAEPDQLLAEVTGQPLPVSHLPAWLLGRPHGAGTVEHDAWSRPSRLREAGWQIDYLYADDAPDALPTRLTAIGDNIELRLRIENWKTTP